MKSSCLLSGLAFCAIVAYADEKVSFVECPKCEKRMRILDDGSRALVNLSRIDASERTRMKERAQRLLELAKPVEPADPLTPLMGWSSWNTFALDISEEIIVGVVGVLQFEVLLYRLKNEYNVEVKLEQLPYEYIRWVENPTEIDVAKIQGTSDMKRICDLKGNPLLLFINSWSIGMVQDRNPNLKLSEFGRN